MHLYKYSKVNQKINQIFIKTFLILGQNQLTSGTVLTSNNSLIIDLISS